jgi:hypothetical protein
MLDAVNSFETLVSIYQNIRHNIPEDSHQLLFNSIACIRKLIHTINTKQKHRNRISYTIWSVYSFYAILSINNRSYTK